MLNFCRFVIETPVRIFGQSERNFWYFQKKTLIQQFYLNLREVSQNLPCGALLRIE